MTEAEPTTLVVDDHPVVRKGLVALLDGEQWAGRCVQADSVASAKAVAVAERPGLAVVDIRLPDGDGVEVVSALRTLVPQCRCLMLTMEANPSLVRRAMDAGAAGYLVKDSDSDLVVDALRTISRGGVVLGREVADAGTAPSTPAVLRRLTPRELQLVELVARGAANQQIARRFGVSEKTVRNQLSAVVAKLGVGGRVQLAVLAREHGIGLEPGNGHPR